MARPMKLMRPQLLNKIYAEHTMGVPVVKLLKKHNIDLTSPTLAKLLNYRHMLEKANAEGNTDAATIIERSIYPKWLTEQDEDILLQPPTHFYSGSMPLGEWQQHNWTDGD